MRLWRSFWRPAHFAALLSGAVPVLAFPAANLELLAWAALVPGFALIRNAATRREAAIRGWWFGAGYLLAAMYWLAPNLGPGLLLVAIVIGALWSLVGVAVWSLLRAPVRPGRAVAALVVVPSSWLVTEWIRSWQGLGGPWAVLGTSQWQHPAVLALAAVGGVWLVSFVLVAANTGLLLALVARTRVLRLAGVAAASLAIAAGPVAFALTAPMPVTRPLAIALVQPGIVSGSAVRLTRDEQLTAAQAGRAGLFVWGESSVGFDLASQPALLAGLRRLSHAARADILVGQDAVSKSGAKSKQATLIGPDGIVGSYVKTRLVPFGEYIPFRSVLGWLSKISRAAPQNVVPGTGARVLVVTAPGARPVIIGPLICFESAFPDMSRVDADHGAQVIVYQTSDSTFQDSWAPAQHAALGALRAAETGRPVVQAALTGDSAAFDGRGRELARAGTNFRGVIIVHVALPPAGDKTIYDRFGDYVPWTAVAIAALAALAGMAGLWSARRKRRSASSENKPGILADSRLSPP
ncbi:MAG: apolipoprotein N-acyltransferase [Streptosporangiaceae bacterium]